MKKYTSYFLGVSLPQKYQDELEKLLSEVKNIDPSLEIVYAETPHITVYYFEKQAGEKLPEIKKKISKYVSVLKGINIEVGGLGFFTKDDPKVLFLNIDYPQLLVDFNEILCKKFIDYNAEENNLKFLPHLTVARIRTELAQESFTKNKAMLEEKFSQISWKFPITELVIYGVDSTKHPEHQEKLIIIPIE